MDIFSKNTYKWTTDTWKDAQHTKLSGECKSKPPWDVTLYFSEWLSSKRQQITKSGKNMDKRGTSCIVGGIVIGLDMMENSIECPQDKYT